MDRDTLFSGAVTLPDHVLIQQLPDSEAVCLNLDTEEYFGLDTVALRMVTVARETPTVEAAFEQLHKEYDTDAETLRHDLHELLEQLLARGLVHHQPV